MKVSEYSKMVMSTVSVEHAKIGLRTMLGNRRTLNIGHAIIGVNTEVGELMVATADYLAGQPIFQSDGALSADVGANVREELGDIAWYTMLGAKFLKVRMPASTKKIKPTATPTELLLKINGVSTELLSLFKKTYYAKGLGEPSVELKRSKEEIKLLTARMKASGRPGEVKPTKKGFSPEKEAFIAAVAEQWQLLIPLLYQLSWSFLKQPISEVMAANHAKLASGPKARYKGGKFSPEAAMTRADKA